MPSLPSALSVVLAALLLAGCLTEGQTRPATPEGASPPSEASPARDGAGGWPDVSQALLRPGVHWGDSRSGVVGVYETEGVVALCTTNFVFRSPDNASLFMGTAAHCVDELKLGDPVTFAFGGATGTLHYDAWKLLDSRGEFDPERDREWDFALLRVDDAYRHLVHPAMYHFGGPTGLAAPEELAFGDPVVTYGNSSLRANQETIRRNTGCISHVDERTANLRTTIPVVPGDSGSPVSTADGRAVGIISEVGSLQEDVPRGNVVATLLAPNLDLARAAGVDVMLVPWPLLASVATPSTVCP